MVDYDGIVLKTYAICNVVQKFLSSDAGGSNNRSGIHNNSGLDN